MVLFGIGTGTNGKFRSHVQHFFKTDYTEYSVIRLFVLAEYSVEPNICFIRIKKKITTLSWVRYRVKKKVKNRV